MKDLLVTDLDIFLQIANVFDKFGPPNTVTIKIEKNKEIQKELS